MLSILEKRRELGELIVDVEQKTRWLWLMFNLRLFARLISAKELNENGVTTVSTACEAIVVKPLFQLVKPFFQLNATVLASTFSEG